MVGAVRRLSVAVILFGAMLTQVAAYTYEECRAFGTSFGQGCQVSPSPYSDCQVCVYNVCNQEFSESCATDCRGAGYTVCS
jgi:hypothetical protein